MPQPSYPFASARVKSRENSIMNHDKALRLAGAESPKEAMRILAELGYGDAEETEPEQFEKCLSAELDQAYDFVEEITPDQKVTNLFFLQYDYHNLKAILKGELKGTGAAQQILLNKGNLEPTAMYEAVREKRYGDFPPEMAQALEELDRRFAVKEDPSLIGLTLDRAYAAQVSRELQDVKESFVREFFSLTFDFANLTAFLRLRRINAGRDLLEKAYLSGGSIPAALFQKAFETTVDDGFSMLIRGPQQRELAAAYDYYKSTGSFAMFHKAKADSLMKLASANRQDLFSIAPVLAYLVGKLREVETIRMILLSKLNGIENKELLDLLPALL